LSEIDFARLCRAARLPEPARQALRKDRHGRNRYLDVVWDLGGAELVVEIDGAVHLTMDTYAADQTRLNELVIDGRVVLRFSSLTVRADHKLVVSQLRRAATAIQTRVVRQIRPHTADSA
jgi:very-short-patch-repair endonuclease